MDAELCRIANAADLPQVNIASGTSVTSAHTSFSAARLPTDAHRYLVASLTKPIVAMALLKLAAEGHMSLTQRIGALLPEFGKAAFRRITLRHLLTHTSGLPDMLPNNAELRAAHASLPDFLEQARSVDLEFSTATDCRYSSVGFLLLAAIVENVAGQPLPRFLREHFFEPLQMQETWLGIPTDDATEVLPTVLPCVLPEWQQDSGDWGWNSEYWRTLGAPWGGLISTAEDLGSFCQMMLRDGASAGGMQVLPSAAVRAAISDQTAEVVSQRVYAGEDRAWGFGWRRQWAVHPASFGDFVSADCVGHWGATGTLMRLEPRSSDCAASFAVVLTTIPYEQSCTAIQQISNVIAASGHISP